MTFLGEERWGVSGLGSSACKIPIRFPSESAFGLHLPRQTTDSSDVRRRLGPAELARAVSVPAGGGADRPSSFSGYGGAPADRPYSFSGYGGAPTDRPYSFSGYGGAPVDRPYSFSGYGGAPADRPYFVSGYGGGPNRSVVKVPGSTPGKIPKPCSDLGKTTKSMARNELEASEVTAARQAAMEYKVDVLEREMGDMQKQMSGIKDQINRLETLMQGLMSSQTRATEQSNLESIQGIRLMRTPEGNFKFPSTGPSVVVTGWEQDQVPNVSMRRMEWENPDEVCVKNDARLEDGMVVSKSEGVEFTIKEDLDCAVLEDFGIPSWLCVLSLPDAVDLAVLEMDSPTDLLKPINVGQSSALRVGQQCLAMGNPFGFDHILTAGVISGLIRDIFSKAGAHFNMKQSAFSRRLILEYSKFSALDSDEPFACKLNNPKHRDTYKQVNINVLNYEAILWEKLPKFNMQQLYFVGLLWNLPPWPDLNFCEVNWMANGMEKGAGTAVKKDTYNAVTGQSKIYSQQAKSKPFIEAGVKIETVSAASGTPSVDLIASGNNTPQRCFSPMKSGTGTFEDQNNSPGVATPSPEFCCPISMKLMSDPVMIASGQTYEREKLSQSCHVHIKQGAFLYNLEVQTLPKSHQYFFIRLKLEYFKFSSLDSYEKSVSDFSYLVKRLVSVAMDRHDKEKEIVSVLLSSVYGAVVKVKMNGKLQDDTVFLKKWHDEEPFEFKTDEEEVIDGIDCAVLVSGSTKRVVRIWDPGTGSKNLKWQSSPLRVVGGLTFGAASAAGRVQPEDLFLTLKVESALYSAGAAESFCTARREDMAVAMCLMLAAKLLYAEGNLISHAVSEKAAEVFEDPGLVGMPQMDSTTAWSNNPIQVRGFSLGQAQEAEPLFRGAFEGPVTGLALDSMRIYSGSCDMTVCIWDRAQMKFVQKFMHADWVGSLAPHENTVNSTTGTDAYLWDIGSGELTSIISNAYVGNAYSLARTHLPDVLFTREEDGAIRLFSVYNVSNDEDINQATTWVLHTSPVHSLAFEYPWLVSASCDGRISLMDLWKLLTPKSSSKHPFMVKSFGLNAIEPPQRMLHDFGCSLFSNDIGADRIVGGGNEALVYTVTNEDRRPYRLSCSVVGLNKNDILMLEEPDESIYSKIKHTKDFLVITLNVFSDTHSKTVVESPGPKSWKNIFIKEPCVILEDVGFCDTHMVLTLRQDRNIFDLRVCVGMMPDVVSYSIMIHGYGFVGKMDEAVVLTGWKPNAFIYSTLLEGYCKEGRTEDTITLFKEMLGKGINPGAITYIIMLDGLIKTWRTAVAKELIKSLKVVYKLQLPEGVGIYLVIPVSQLKIYCGPQAIISPDLSLWEICHLLMLMGKCQLHQ